MTPVLPRQLGDPRLGRVDVEQDLLLSDPATPEALGKRAEPDREGAKLIIQNALARKRRVLDLVESKALLAAFGIPVVRSIPAHDPNEALAIAEEFGFPVAMKTGTASHPSHGFHVNYIGYGPLPDARGWRTTATPAASTSIAAAAG